MIEEHVIWRTIFTPTPENLLRLLHNRSTEEPTIWSTTSEQTESNDSRLPSLSTYFGLFVCLLLFLLAVVTLMLCRIKHKIAPLQSDVESKRETEEQDWSEEADP